MNPVDLARWMEKMEMPVSEVANFLGVHRATVYGWLSGKPIPQATQMLMLVMKEYGVEPRCRIMDRIRETIKGA